MHAIDLNVIASAKGGTGDPQMQWIRENPPASLNV